jgi:NAD(P)-dependent dehydrogenase (short-subunit alcohol dehydrogenase family)
VATDVSKSSDAKRLIARILALTKSAAQEYAQEHIRVNCLVAGGFHTPLLHGILERASGGDPAPLEQMEQRYNEATPLGRIGDPPKPRKPYYGSVPTRRHM